MAANIDSRYYCVYADKNGKLIDDEHYWELAEMGYKQVALEPIFEKDKLRKGWAFLVWFKKRGKRLYE